MGIVLFEEVTTESVLLGLEADGIKYEGLVVDMEVREQRKYVKDSAALIAGLLKKLDRSRIDKSKEFKNRVEAEAASIKGRLETANLPFSMLIDAHANDRKLILAKKKAQEDFKELRDQVESDHEMGLLMYADHIRQLKEYAIQARAEQEAHDANVAAQATIDAEAAAKAAIDQAEQDKQDAINREARARQDAIAAEERRLEQIKQSEINAKAAADRAETSRIEAIERARLESIAAAERAEYNAQAAVRAEQQRQANEKAEADRAQRLRESNQENVHATNNMAFHALCNVGVPAGAANLALRAIINGEIPGVSINY